MLFRTLASILRGYIWFTPPHPGRGLIGKLAHRLDSRAIIHYVRPDVRVRLSLNNSDHITYWSGGYEEHNEIDLFLESLTPGMTVFDIGANIGMYAAAIAAKVGATGRVIALEPIPHIHEHLLDTISLNNCDNATALRLAASDTVGTATFHLGRWDSLGSLVRGQPGTGLVTVETTTLDTLVETMKVSQVDAVKIDAEGAEPLVIRGMQNLFAKGQRPILMVEFNYPALAAAGCNPGALFAEILSLGYSAFAMIGGRAVPSTKLVEPSRRTAEPTMNYLFRVSSPAE